MPNIPVTLSKEGYDTSGLERSYSRVTATPDMFGAQIGKALESLGTGIGQASHRLEQYLKEGEAQRSEEQSAVLTATTAGEFQRAALEAQRTAVPGGAGTAERTLKAHQEIIDKNAPQITDPKARSRWVTGMQTRAAGYQVNAVTFEFKQSEEYAKQQADDALDDIDKQVRTNPNSYDQAVKDSNDIINTRKHLDTDTREKMKIARAHQLANTRVEGQIAAARTADDLIAVQVEITGGKAIPPGGTAKTGNINVNAMPIARNPDGSIVPMKTKSFNIDGVEVLVPTTTPEGKQLSDEEAQKRYKDTGEHLGMFNNAKEAATYAKELSAQQAALHANSWQKRLKPSDYEQLLTKINAGINHFQTQADQQAHLMLETLDGRAKSTKERIAPDELRYVYEFVVRSKNPAHMARFFRINKDEQIKQETVGQGLPPSEIKRREQAAQGGVGSIPHNVPAEMVTHIGEAAKVFGVPEVFLGITTWREYRGNYPAYRGRGSPKFAPTPSQWNQGADIKNLQPRVQDALTVVGQVFGEPLRINSGYRSASHPVEANKFRPGRPGPHVQQHAVDIDTTGMSASRQAELVSSLIQGGFTGLGQYPSHIHADMRQTVTTWTGFSPEVQAVRDARGHRAGALDTAIDRSGPGQQILQSGTQPQIDYTKRSSAGAAGPFQITQATWTDLTDVKKNPEIVSTLKQVTGVDFSTMNPAERWKYVDQPRMNTLVAAANTAVNRNAIRAALKAGGSDREPTNAELYMAHFFGVKGGPAFIQAFQTNPGQAGAAAFPEAAAEKDNYSVFYHKDGKTKTIREIYDQMTHEFMMTPGLIQHGDAVTYGRIYKDAQTQTRENPVGYRRQTGDGMVVPLTAPGGWEARGAIYRDNGEKYELANTGANKPFDVETELPALKKQWEEADAAGKMAMMRDIMRMDRTGHGASDAGMAQLGIDNSAYSAAAQLLATDPAAANTVAAGVERTVKNPNADKVLGSKQDNYTAFQTAVGNSMNGMDAKTVDALFKAANAHYIETMFKSALGTGAKLDQFNETEYKKSIQTVVAGHSIAMIDGQLTMVPRGVTPERFQLAVDNATPEDMIKYSVTQDGRPLNMPPRYQNGDIPTAVDIRANARWQYIRDDVYSIVMTSDYKELVIANTRGGGFQRYYVKFNKDAVDEITSRPSLVRDTVPPGVIPPTVAPPVLGTPNIGGILPGQYTPAPAQPNQNIFNQQGTPPAGAGPGQNLPPGPQPNTAPPPPPGGGTPRSTDISGQARMADHEQSETIQNEKGEWVNVYGANLPKAGQQLPGTPTYNTMEEAVKAAIQRSKEHGKRRPKGKG